MSVTVVAARRMAMRRFDWRSIHHLKVRVCFFIDSLRLIVRVFEVTVIFAITHLILGARPVVFNFTARVHSGVSVFVV
jgi:hypothetical protein